MRALGFVREVIIDPDHPEMNPGCDAQHGAINDYAGRQGWELVDVVYASSSASAELDLQSILARLSAGEADVFVVALSNVVWNDSRECRTLLERGRSDGWEIVITGTGLDTTTPEGRAAIDAVLATPYVEVPACSRPMPPARLIYRVTGTYDLELFDVSGFHDLVLLESALGEPLAARRDILDFGCGCGRLLRRLFDQAPTARISGCDIDEDAIAWLGGNMSGADAKVCGPLPPLPFAADAFDLIIGYSVLTHLDEDYQDAWLEEMTRVLRPGGVALLTVHGPTSWERIVRTALAGRPELHELDHERSSRGIVHWRDDGWGSVFPDFYHTTFHTPDYIRRHWTRWFDAVEIVAGTSARDHDIVVARVAK
jgi:SAM-dependent methyltransferase